MTENENCKETLENHLHKQYAENDNNRIGVFTSFIIGIVALFGFYGYVFVNTNKREYWNFDIQEFLLMSFVTIGILFFLAILSLSFGYSLRRDHFIVFNIRKKRYNNAEVEEIFGKIYDPHGKNFFDFLPDLYNLFYWLFLSSEIFIFITIFIKIYDFKNNGSKLCNCIIILHIILLFHIILIMLTIIFRYYYYRKYTNNITQGCQIPKHLTT